jgi:hypothetical protein
MTKSEQPRAHRIRDWREKRASKRALKGDTPEKLRERTSPGAQSNVKDNANRAGMGGFVSGGF